MIEVEGLVHRYGDTPAVEGVSLAVADGEFLLLVGPNGSGKTTLVRHFNGLLEPVAGTVRVNGRDVSEDLVAARTAVGMTFQDPRDAIVAGTVRADVAFGPENLGLSRAEIDRRVDEALRAVRLDSRASARVQDLSGGERQRLAIAGALAMEPDHLVLDEPFTGLDWPARRSVLDRLRALHASGTGIVLVTHDLRDVAALADRVVVLSEGRLALDEADPDPATLAALGVRPPPVAEWTPSTPVGDESRPGDAVPPSGRGESRPGDESRSE